MKALLNSESRYNKQRSLNRMNFSVCNNFPYKIVKLIDQGSMRSTHDFIKNAQTPNACSKWPAINDMFPQTAWKSSCYCAIICVHTLTILEGFSMKRTIALWLSIMLCLLLAACSQDSSDLLKVPVSANDCKGKNYQDVVNDISAAGFVNIQTKTMALLQK